jgi:hypothetical protein
MAVVVVVSTLMRVTLGRRSRMFHNVDVCEIVETF